MATSFSPRVGLMRWTDNSDPYPTRAEWDAEQNVLENVVAVWRGQGTLADRPSASVPGGFYVVPESDYATMYYDTGSKWIELATIGGVTPNGIAVAGSNSQGTSTRAARADHTHSIPLVTSSAHGAMSSADKALLDAATGTATANTLVRRDSAGRSYFNSVGLSSDPVNLTDATRKGYVDSGDASARSEAEATAATALAPVKALTDAATANATGNTLMRRDFSGRASVGTPEIAAHATTKGYVDAGDNAARSYADTAVSNIPDATTSVRGLMSAADKSLLDDATNIAATSGSRLVRRDSSGRYRAVDPSDQYDVVNKRTMEAGLATRVAATTSIPEGTNLDTIQTDGFYAQNLSANATTALNYPVGVAGLLAVASTGNMTYQTYRVYSAGGTTDSDTYVRGRYRDTWHPWRKIAFADLATSSSDGLMPRTDKALLDAATSSSTGNTLVRRDASGRVSVGTPTATSHAARKDYVDSAVSGAVDPVKALTDAATPNATANTIVRRDASSRFRSGTPSATTDVANKAYVDSAASSAQSAAETTAANALAPVKTTAEAAKALTDAATANATANTIVRRDASNRFKSGTPSATTDVANKSYVDGKANTAQSNAEATAASALAPVETTVDNATDAATAGRLVLRDSAGRFKAAAPSATTDVANKAYVDDYVLNNRVPETEVINLKPNVVSLNFTFMGGGYLEVIRSGNTVMIAGRGLKAAKPSSTAVTALVLTTDSGLRPRRNAWGVSDGGRSVSVTFQGQLQIHGGVETDEVIGYFSVTYVL